MAHLFKIDISNGSGIWESLFLVRQALVLQHLEKKFLSAKDISI
jgi:hypothetical protein